jgi:hypothetical protein
MRAKTLAILAVFSLAAAFTAEAATTQSQTVIARSGRYVYTEASLQDILDVDTGVLESPLTAAEQAQIRTLVIDEFNRDPAKIASVLPTLHNVAIMFRSGQLYDRAVAREKDWEITLQKAPSDPIAARSLEIMRKHTPIIASANGLVVTSHEIDAMFASSDIIAQVAGQPKSTPEQRAAFTKSLPGRFAQLSPIEQEQIAHAERRVLALRGTIYAYTDLRAKAEAQIHTNVHGPEDVPKEARRLEDWGIKFADTMQTFARREVAISAEEAKLNSVRDINFATRKFMGQGP